MRIRLTRKLAHGLNGIDLSAYTVGDVFEVPRSEAEALITEGWAVAAVDWPPRAVNQAPARPRITVTRTLLKLRTVEQLRRARERLADGQVEEQARRRAEDRIREEIHDLRAKTITGSATGNRRNRP